MRNNLIAQAAILVNASRKQVWDALVDPKAIRRYMFGADVVSDWREGSSIIWRGEWQDKAYEDKGKILRIAPERLIQYSHFSPLSGMPDTPENYHIVTVSLASDGLFTHIMLTQDNNANEEERQHSEKNWQSMLEGLKKYVEQPENQPRADKFGLNPGLKKLTPLVGEWDVVAIRGELRQPGQARFAWLEEGAYLLYQCDFKPADLPPPATWIIGTDESSPMFHVLYFDARGVSRILQMSMEDSTWKMWREDPHFAECLTGKFSEDGRRIDIYLEKSIEGKEWEHDFDLVFTRKKG